MCWILGTSAAGQQENKSMSCTKSPVITFETTFRLHVEKLYFIDTLNNKRDNGHPCHVPLSGM